MLERHVRAVREFTASILDGINIAGENSVNAIIGASVVANDAITHVPPTQELVPRIVLISGMAAAGSMAARNRGRFLRYASPALMGALSAYGLSVYTAYLATHNNQLPNLQPFSALWKLVPEDSPLKTAPRSVSQSVSSAVASVKNAGSSLSSSAASLSTSASSLSASASALPDKLKAAWPFKSTEEVAAAKPVVVSKAPPSAAAPSTSATAAPAAQPNVDKGQSNDEDRHMYSTRSDRGPDAPTQA
ncbi:hypothetical protein, variant [Capsaspora owczarzaki ATCC 30864]|uniref:MICOS complex subunit n=2 Tax=Capsaspora owczarzaki (strain ATCC 30864) TaxID=595528 RepID=A0A0D2VYL6_CAPO3|nr:hypothetical protein, variant [Capsaspora owczarzaki ATCC 30864]